MLPSALNFTDLPSDRAPRSEAARAMGRLVEKAVWRGPNGVGHPADMARRNLRRLQDGAPWPGGRELSFEARPGAMLEREPEEVREALRGLRSLDVQTFAVDPVMVGDWPRALPEPCRPGSTPTHRR